MSWMIVQTQAQADWVDVAERLTTLTGGALAFLLIILLVTNRLLVTKVRHDDVIAQFERLIETKDQEYRRLQEQKDREIAWLTEQHDWWKDATVTALNIGEAVTERGGSG